MQRKSIRESLVKDFIDNIFLFGSAIFPVYVSNTILQADRLFNKYKSWCRNCSFKHAKYIKLE